MPKILVIRFSSIGDIVLASPVLRCLKQQLTGAEVHFLTKRSFKAVTEANPYVDKFFYFDNDLDSVITELKKEDYDYVVDLHKNFRSLKVKSALGKKNFTIKKLTWQKFLLTKLHINLMPERHITQRSLDTVAKLGVTDDGLGLDYFIPEQDEVNMERLPSTHRNGYVAIAIGASYETKKLPVYKLQELCRNIDQPIILLGGKEDEANGDEIASVDSINIFNACGKFKLNESADLVRNAALVVSHDTGLQYIACAFNKKVLAVWGSTSPALDVEPYYGSETSEHMYENIIVPMKCQPCTKYGRDKCPLGHFNCMNKQDMVELAGKVNAAIFSMT
jgi:ADP-heptose:LPS heptosyltransferase